MNNEEKLEIFKNELNLITNEEVRKFTEEMIYKLPDYFWKVPASSTNKYHPKFAQQEGGLVLHTKANVRISYELLRLKMFKPFLEFENEIYSALILHDGTKHGLNGSKYTVAEHPLVISKLIKETSNFDKQIINKVCGLIEPHMGEWNKDYRTKKEILPKPDSKLKWFVHLVDYISSRQCISHDFEAKLTPRN